MPSRIQRRRSRGWRAPEDAVYVGRGSVWGNSWRVDPDRAGSSPLAVRDRAEATARYCEWLTFTAEGRALAALARQRLRGRTLMCWCPEGTHCHGDFLADIAATPGPCEPGAALKVGSVCSGYGGLELGLASALGPVSTAWVADTDEASACVLAARPIHGEKTVPDATLVRPAFAGGTYSGRAGATPHRTVPVSSAAWEGWGTALKPSFEPCVVARRPLDGTVADNVLAHGVGGINIDACRIHSAGSEGRDYTVRRLKSGAELNRTGGNWRPEEGGEAYVGRTKDGRWPSNVVLDEEAAHALDAEAPESVSRRGKPRQAAQLGEGWGMRATGAEYSDSGGPSRFFPVFPAFRYEVKASADERPSVGGVSHPTVKPLALMRWLVRLVTPYGGMVLDPFAGSGTTLEAAVAEGMRAVGVEREESYLPLIASRLDRPVTPVLDLGIGGL